MTRLLQSPAVPLWETKHAWRNSPEKKTPSSALPPPADEYLEHLLVQKGLAENTLQAYTADLTDFAAFLEERRASLTEVNDQTLFLYIVYVRRKGLSGRSLARRLSALRGQIGRAHV